MKTLACIDMEPSLNCDYVAKAETDEGVIKDLTAHGMSAHPETMEKMKGMSEEEVKAMMMPHIKEEGE